MTTEAQFIISAKERTKPAFNQIKRNLQTVEQQSKRTQSAISHVMAPLSAYAAFAGVRRLTTDFGNFEEALVKVGKTANIEGADLKKFGNDIKNLNIPVATNDLLKYAEAAGQLGITGNDNLLKFVDTMARLEKSSDLAGEESAKAIARVINVTGEGIGTVDRFGSVLVALGNTFAASESEILGHTTEVSRAIAVYDVGAAQAAAFGTSMASLGIRAESGGSVVGRTFNSMNTAIESGGEKLQQLMAITGLTEQQLKTTFKDNAESVFQSFLTGLNKIDAAGGNMIATLENFGLKGEEINKTLPVMAKNSTLLARAMTIANKEVEDATALTKESNTAFQTMNAELELTKKTLTSVSSEIGERLSPAITGISSTMREWLGDTDDISSSIDTLSNVALAGLVGITAKYVVTVGTATKAKVADIVSTNAKIKTDQADAAQTLATARQKVAAAGAQLASTQAVKARVFEGTKLVAQMQLEGITAKTKGASFAAVSKVEIANREHLRSSVDRLKIAQTQYNVAAVQGTVVSRTLSSSMALLGGPAGVIMLAAGALTYFISSSGDASDKTKLLSGDVKELEKNYKSLSSAKIQHKLLEVNDALSLQKTKLESLKNTMKNTGKSYSESGFIISSEMKKQMGLEVLSEAGKRKIIVATSGQEDAQKLYNEQLAIQKKLEEQLLFLNKGGSPTPPKKELLNEELTGETPEQARARIAAEQEEVTAALKRQQLQSQYEDLKTSLMLEDELLLQTATKRQVLIAELWQSGVITDSAKYGELANQANAQYLAKLDAIEAQELARNENKLMRMDEQWLTESEKLDAQHLEELGKYRSLVDSKLLTEQDYENRKLKLKDKYAKAHKKLKDSENKSIFSMTTGIFKTMGGLQSRQSKKMFEIQKSASLANAAVTLPSAVVKAFDNGGGLPWGAVPAALTLGAGLKQINMIKKQSFGGGNSISSSVGGSGSGSTPSIPSPQSLGLESKLSSNLVSENKTEAVRNYFIVEGDLIGNDADVMFEHIKEKIETTDAVLIETHTRQAKELSGVE